MKDLLIKAEELKQLATYLDTIPHAYGKQIESFLTELYQKREAEALAIKPKKA